MKVLLATDGSEFSRSAIDACRDLVAAGEVEAVKVISVYEAQVPLAAEPLVVSTGYYQKLNELARGRARVIADDAVRQCRDCRPGDPVRISTSVRLGEPATVIVEAAKDWDADLIIVGSHGRGFWGRLALGSVSDAVLHHAPCSVLVVRNKQH